MLTQLWRRLFTAEVRRSSRHSVSDTIQCFVFSSKFPAKMPAYVGDVSSTGISYFSKGSWFEPGDAVGVSLVRGSENVDLSGKIVSQKIYYPAGSEDLKHALYRYSIQLSVPLDHEWVDGLAGLARQKPPTKAML